MTLVPVAPVFGATAVDTAVFLVGAVIILAGAFGVVLSRNPVHAALMLVSTLFGVAVLFVEQGANFLAAVQVIVYAGAIVVLFLFVIMFLGVDRLENVSVEPLPAQRPLAVALAVLALGGLIALGVEAHWAVGAHSVAGSVRGASGGDVAALGKAVFTIYLFPFEITAALLLIAVVGAVVLARRPTGPSSTPAAQDQPASGDSGSVDSEAEGAPGDSSAELSSEEVAR
ncbi:MAG TPA: NADH-quinone oxidoreductase subunit J [Acidimicrobiales bacterium]|nr:NADH-quinone oxidoreductase subunit J [Acidimicrobiales bacterium]